MDYRSSVERICTLAGEHSVKELKQILREHGLGVTGNKKQLCQRIADHLGMDTVMKRFVDDPETRAFTGTLTDIPTDVLGVMIGQLPESDVIRLGGTASGLRKHAAVQRTLLRKKCLSPPDANELKHFSNFPQLVLYKPSDTSVYPATLTDTAEQVWHVSSGGIIPYDKLNLSSVDLIATFKVWMQLYESRGCASLFTPREYLLAVVQKYVPAWINQPGATRRGIVYAILQLAGLLSDEEFEELYRVVLQRDDYDALGALAVDLYLDEMTYGWQEAQERTLSRLRALGFLQ